MKKLVMLLLCGGMLVACSKAGYDVKVSNSDDVLISGSEISISKQDYFEYLLESNGANDVLTQAISIISEKELTDQSEIDKLVNERKESYTKYADTTLEEYAKKLGYKSVDQFVEEYLMPSVKTELLRNKYLKEHLDDFIKSYQVTTFKKIVVTKESEALTLIKESTSAEIFDKKLKDAGASGEDTGLVTKNSTLDDNLKAKLETLSKVDKDGVYSEPIKLSDDTYAVLYLYNTDHKNTDAITESLSNEADIQEEVEGIYLKKYNFEVHDAKIKSAIKKLSDQYIE